MNTCIACRFFIPTYKNIEERDVDDSHGKCHRFPPIFVKGDEEDFIENTSVFAQPVVWRDDWCGEFSAKNPV